MCSNTYILFLNFKVALYSSALAIKLFNYIVESCFKIITVKLKASLLLNTLLCIRPLTFITEVLHLSSSPSVASSQHAVLIRPRLPILSIAGVN